MRSLLPRRFPALCLAVGALLFASGLAGSLRGWEPSDTVGPVVNVRLADGFDFPVGKPDATTRPAA